MAQLPVIPGNPADKTSLNTNFNNTDDNFTELYSEVAKIAIKPWADATAFVAGNVIFHVDELYVCILNHTSVAGIELGGNEPRVGPEWATCWQAITITDDERATLSNAQPDIGEVGTAGVYFIEETVLGLRGIYSPGTWRMFYSDGTPGVKEVSIGSAGTFLKSNGTGGAPGWESPLTSENLRTLQAAAGNNFVAGSVGYLHTDGTIVLADASDANTCMQLLFMATDTIAGGAWGVFSRWGDVTVTGHGLGLGLPIFLSVTAGEMSTTGPVGGNVARVIGYAITANVIDFRPDPTWAGIPA